VNGGEEAERELPARFVVADDLLEQRFFGVFPGEAGVERRTALVEALGESPEDVGKRRRLGGAQLSRAALARSATLVKAAGSFTARSASTLRSSTISAFLQPEMNWL
jgi:hypothetical protein